MRRWIADGVKVRMCVTSPPYWGLRDYGVPGQLGLEATPEGYVANMVEVFRLVRELLADDGTLWLNLGDCYHNGDKGGYAKDRVKAEDSLQKSNLGANFIGAPNRQPHPLLKPKDLVGIPWSVALALRADGWWLRSEITWCKKAPMPESVTDRPTSATEKIFLLTEAESYYYDADAVRNPPSEAMLREVAEGYNGHAVKMFDDAGVQNASEVKSRIIDNARKRVDKQRGHSRRHAGLNDRWDSMTKEEQMACGSNMRNYWVLGPDPFPDAHFAVFPSEIPRRCILAGSRPGDVVLDPFLGSGTTAEVAQALGRQWLGCELNPEYAKLQDRRTAQQGLVL
jgi:site-specific DNA-methyltransferase (cytosine-N4-specific)